MKILKWIDNNFLDSFDKRVFLFMCLVGFYWLWQAIWQIILFFNLYQLSDYSSLFALHSNLDSYSSSVLVRMIYKIISGSFYVLNCINFIDIFCVIGYILLIKKWKISTIILGLKWIWLGICLFIGLQSNSLNIVIFLLKMLGAGSIVFEIGFMIIMLYSLVNELFSLDKKCS